MSFIQIFCLNMPILFSESRDGRIECDAVHPRGDLGFAPERGKGFPELKYNLLEKIITGLPITFIHEADLVDQSLMLIDQVNEFYFVPNHSRSFFGQFVECNQRKLQIGRRYFGGP